MQIVMGRGNERLYLYSGIPLFRQEEEDKKAKEEEERRNKKQDEERKRREAEQQRQQEVVCIDKPKETVDKQNLEFSQEIVILVNCGCKYVAYCCC